MVANDPAAALAKMRDELKEKRDAATQGEWYTLCPPWQPPSCLTYIFAGGNGDPHGGQFVCDFEAQRDRMDAEENSDSDAEFIVHAANTAAPLITAIDAVLASVAAKDAEIAELRSAASEAHELEAAIIGLPTFDPNSKHDTPLNRLLHAVNSASSIVADYVAREAEFAKASKRITFEDAESRLGFDGTPFTVAEVNGEILVSADDLRISTMGHLDQLAALAKEGE